MLAFGRVSASRSLNGYDVMVVLSDADTPQKRFI
jgi:hypothetical protein